MKMKRPIAVTGLSCLMIAAGVGGIIMGIANARALWPVDQGLIWIAVFGLAGIICGIFMLLGRGWARWLTLAWVGCHVGISFFHARREVVVHVVIFALIAMLLFRADVRVYFGGSSGAAER